MDKIRVLIVEDNGLIAEGIRTTLERHALNVVGVCSSGEEALDVFRTSHPDIILMDIHLSGALDGIATAKLIHDETTTPVVYLTDFADARTVERAIKTGPANYLTKPFHEGELIRAIEIAVRNAATQTTTTPSVAGKPILIRSQQAFIRLPIEDVLYLKAARAYCEIVTEQNPILLSSSMSQVLTYFKGYDLLQVHRSYCISLQKIKSLDGNTLTVGTHEIPVSKEYREMLLSRLNLVK